MKYAFTNADGIVVQLITGSLNATQQEMFLRDYSILFGATAIIEVEDGTTVWIGGTYTDAQFQPPPQPVPVPEVTEGTSEELPPLEVLDDALPD
jgi:hypothetical protein